MGAQQETFQAEGTAIPFPGLCLEASPGTCMFPGQVCVYVCVCVCARAHAGSIPGWGGPHMLCDMAKKKKRGFGQSAQSAKWAQGWRVQVAELSLAEVRGCWRTGQGLLWEH